MNNVKQFFLAEPWLSLSRPARGGRPLSHAHKLGEGWRLRRCARKKKKKTLVFTVCIGSPISSGGISLEKKQTENCVAGKVSLQNAFLPWRRAPLSQRSRCVFEATVVIVIYYRGAKKPKVCKHSPRTEGTWSRDTQTHTGTHASSLVKHSFFTPQSVELCLQGPIFK